MDDPLPRRAALIVNAKSRKGRQQFKRACRLFKAEGFELVESFAVRKPETLPGLVEKAVAKGVPMVIVGGGDGTMSAAVDKVVGTEAVFVALPLGTANSFARTIGLPLELPDAVKAIAGGVVRDIDLGMVDDDYFANCATLGIAPEIAETVPHGLKSWLGRPGYLVWAARQLMRFKPFRVTLSVDGETTTLDVVEVRIANGRFHGGVEMVQDATLESGQIVVQVVIGQTRRSLIGSWIATVLRMPPAQRRTRDFRGKEIRIATDRPMPISIDGEVLAKTPVVARVASRSLRIATPRG